MSEPIRVVVCGALGRVGSEVVRAVAGEKGLVLVGGVDPKATEAALPITVDGQPVLVTPNLSAFLSRLSADVLVDFTRAEASIENVRIALKDGLACVVGTTGLSQGDLDEIADLSARQGRGVVVAPNFALGAVLMMHFAKIAARYFDSAEIIELHHDGKADAPSGTALLTAQGMLAAHGAELRRAPTLLESLVQVRGGNLGGVGIHSVRLPGLVAHQEVIFGGLGQTLTIRHDSTSRESYIPGVLMAIRHVAERPQFVHGLDQMLGLE